MQKEHMPQQGLDRLSEQFYRLQSPDVLVHLGAGVGDSLDVWQRLHADRIVLVEPNPDCLSELRQKSDGLLQVEILPIAVSNRTGQFELGLMSDNAFSSLRPPTALMQIMPGLSQVGRATVACQSVTQLLEGLQIDGGGVNWLVIDTPGEEAAILQSLFGSDFRHLFTVVVLRASAEALYDGSVAAEELVNGLKRHGYAVQAKDPCDADFPQYCLTLDRLAVRSEELAVKVSKLEQENKAQEDEAFKQAEESRKSLASKDETIAQREEELVALKKTLQAQEDEAFKQAEESRKSLASKDETIAQLKKELNVQSQVSQRFSQLENKLGELFGEQRSYIQQTTNALGQHVTFSARQQRDEQALIHYLQHGKRPDSAALAPGYSVALLEHYDLHHHDVVVVLGAQETTEMLAGHILHVRKEQPRLTQKKTVPRDGDDDIALSQADLPQTVISIEHQRAASEEHIRRLKNKHRSDAVNVVLAPWVEHRFNEQSGLFYAAESTLQRLGQWLPDDARVLLIVGEALPKAGHSRELVLPLLLQHLTSQRLDIVLEGDKYPQENGLATGWDALLATRQRSGRWLKIPSAHSLSVDR